MHPDQFLLHFIGKDTISIISISRKAISIENINNYLILVQELLNLLNNDVPVRLKKFVLLILGVISTKTNVWQASVLYIMVAQDRIFYSE